MKKIAALLAILSLAIDQLTKYFAVKFFVENITTIEITEFFNLVLVYNKGISFGLFNNINYGNYIFTFLSFSIIVWLLKWIKNSVIVSESVALGLIVGGAVGNVLDRLFRPGVVDFIQLHYNSYYWPNFNVADSAIFLGVMVLIILNFNLKE